LQLFFLDQDFLIALYILMVFTSTSSQSRT